MLKIRTSLFAATGVGLALSVGACERADAAVRYVASVAANQVVEFQLHVPLRNTAQLESLIRLQADAKSPQYHHFLSPAQFAAAFGPSPATIARIKAGLAASGLEVTAIDSQIIHVRGVASTVARDLASPLRVARDERGRLSIVAPRLQTPANLASLGIEIVDLSAPHSPHSMLAQISPQPNNRYSNLGPYWFDDLKQAYDYPAYSYANGAGVTIATVGFSDFSSSDVNAYFEHEKVGQTAGDLVKQPTYKHVLLNGYAPFDPTSLTSSEADLDVEQAAGSAPGATIMGVSIGGPGESFLRAYSYLVTKNIADIITTSYGDCELYYTAAYNNGVDELGVLKAYHQIFQQGNAQGQTFIFSSGDSAGLGCFPIGYFGPAQGKSFSAIPGAGYWADDANVTAVGGTNLLTTLSAANLSSKYVSENAVGDRIASPVDFYGTGNFITGAMWGSGSGISSIVPKPDYQRLVTTRTSSGRSVPDIAMQMGGCPSFGGAIVNCDEANRDSFDAAVVGGQLVGMIGTSAAAPEFAGLLAVKESHLRTRMGNENYDIYLLAALQPFGYGFYHQGIVGDNGVVQQSASHSGYSNIIGVGTPDARRFILAPNSPAAGMPQSATNP